jgi:hypothetical protein
MKIVSYTFKWSRLTSSACKAKAIWCVRHGRISTTWITNLTWAWAGACAQALRSSNQNPYSPQGLYHGPQRLQKWQWLTPPRGDSSFTFGYRRTVEIFKTPPIHIFNIFDIYFRWKSWPNHIFHNNIVTCLYIYFYQFKNFISMYMYSFYPCGPKLTNKIFYSI